MTITHADVPRLFVESDLGTPVPVLDPAQWATSTPSASVATTWLDHDDGDDRICVSTVFLGFSADPTEVPPVCYETCVFRGTNILERVLSHTRDEAQLAHDDLVEELTSLQ